MTPDQWNKLNPVGTTGVLRKDCKVKIETSVRAPAYMLGGKLVASFKGVTGAYLAERFDPDEDQEQALQRRALEAFIKGYRKLHEDRGDISSAQDAMEIFIEEMDDDVKEFVTELDRSMP